jgi:hypothetical protein
MAVEPDGDAEVEVEVEDTVRAAEPEHPEITIALASNPTAPPNTCALLIKPCLSYTLSGTPRLDSQTPRLCNPLRAAIMPRRGSTAHAAYRASL